MGLNLSKINKLHVQLKYARSILKPCVHDSQTIGQLEKHFHLDQLCFVEMLRFSEQQRNNRGTKQLACYELALAIVRSPCN